MDTPWKLRNGVHWRCAPAEEPADAMVGVDFVFHVAALKQVPSSEFYPTEALMTNAIGAGSVIDCSVYLVRRATIMCCADSSCGALAGITIVFTRQP